MPEIRLAWLTLLFLVTAQTSFAGTLGDRLVNELCNRQFGGVVLTPEEWAEFEKRDFTGMCESTGDWETEMYFYFSSGRSYCRLMTRSPRYGRSICREAEVVREGDRLVMAMMEPCSYCEER